MEWLFWYVCSLMLPYGEDLTSDVSPNIVEQSKLALTVSA